MSFSPTAFQIIINLIDIFFVAFLIYETIILIRGTRAVQMLLGILILVLVYFIAEYLGMPVTSWLLDGFIKYFVLILIILFQNDIRKALAGVGRNPFFSRVSKIEEKQVIEQIVQASFYMANRRIGALIVLERRHILDSLLEGCTTIDAIVTSRLLEAIFYPSNPLHDGAVIIKEGKIFHAGCFLPLTSNPELPKFLGTRHRAAIGISEETDAVVIVVSEETQNVSLVQHGALTAMHDDLTLTNSLHNIFLSKEDNSAGWKNWISKS